MYFQQKNPITVFLFLFNFHEQGIWMLVKIELSIKKLKYWSLKNPGISRQYCAHTHIRTADRHTCHSHQWTLESSVHPLCMHFHTYLKPTKMIKYNNITLFWSILISKTKTTVCLWHTICTWFVHIPHWQRCLFENNLRSWS